MSVSTRPFVFSTIMFDSGEYNSGSLTGQYVLADELTHVRQQTSGAVSMLPQEKVHLQRYPGQERVEQAREQITDRL